MSTTTDRSGREGDREKSPEEVIREHREAFEYLAETDLPIAVDCQRALDHVDEVGADE